MSEERNDANVGSFADSSAVMDKLAGTEAALGQEKDRSLQGGVIRTLNGDEIEDEIDQDAINYQILLGKIDQLLDRLKLDA
jgi:ankyrin repeat/BTB/POZ domain-containing protein 1